MVKYAAVLAVYILAILTLAIVRGEDQVAIIPNMSSVTRRHLQGNPPPTNVVTLYSSENYQGVALEARAGLFLSSIAFIRHDFPSIGSVVVPPSYVFVGYECPYFQCNSTVWTKSDHSTAINNGVTLVKIMSFKVHKQSEWSEEPPPQDINKQVRCTFQPPKQPDEYLRGRFGVGSYPLITGYLCNKFYIPDGLVIVGYDRPWFVGNYQVWNTSGYFGNEWVVRLRSLRVYRIKDLPALPPQDPPLLAFIGPSFLVLSAVYQAGQDEPAVDSWFTNIPSASDGYLMVLPESYSAVFYSEYNFKGNFTVIKNTNQSKYTIYNPYKSVKIVKYSEWATKDPASTSFVGCYTPWTVVTPIFLQESQAIDIFAYPWNAFISRLTIPTGLVVIGYEEPNFQGANSYWTSDIEDMGDWDQRIQSIRVLNVKNWTRPTTTAKPTTTILPTTTSIVTTTSSPATKLQVPSTPAATEDAEPSSEEQVFSSESVSTTTSAPPSMPQKNSTGPITNSTTSSKNYTNATKQVIVAPRSSQPRQQGTTSEEPQTPQEPTNVQPGANSSKSMSLTTYIVIAAVGAALTSIIVAIILTRRRKRLQAAQALSNSIEYTEIKWGDVDLIRMDIAPLPLTHQLAVGATGSVWLASIQQTPVVVKTFLSDSPAEEEVQNLIDEVSFMSSLSCPYIVHLIGVTWTHPSNLQVIVEYMNLGDLREFLSKTDTTSFAWKNKLESALSVAEALFYLHSQQMIHRDLKSRNILLDSEKGTKLGDFGSSKEVVGDTMTAAIGTFRWMAPEMLMFKPYTESVDIYSFGVVLSELVTHALPYEGLCGEDDGVLLSEEAVVSRVIHDGLRPGFGTDCPEWYQVLATRCMCGDASVRPSAPELIYILKSKIRQL